MNQGLTKSYLGGAVVNKYRIVKIGADDDHAIQAAAATDAPLGVSRDLGASAAEKPFDVQLEGIAAIEYGGNVTRGDDLTSDANGKAVTAAPASGVNNGVIGQALVSGVDGDIGRVHLRQGTKQG